MCFIFWHQWRCVNVFHYIDASWGTEAPSTTATYVCTKCNATKTKDFYSQGYLTMTELNQAGENK